MATPHPRTAQTARLVHDEIERLAAGTEALESLAAMAHRRGQAPIKAAEMKRIVELISRQAAAHAMLMPDAYMLGGLYASRGSSAKISRARRGESPKAKTA